MFKILVFCFKITLFVREHASISSLFIKHLHDLIVSLIREAWGHIAGFIPPLFIEVPVTTPESDRSRTRICVLGVSILFLSTILLLDFGNVLTIWYFFYFNPISQNIALFNFTPKLLVITA